MESKPNNTFAMIATKTARGKPKSPNDASRLLRRYSAQMCSLGFAIGRLTVELSGARADVRAWHFISTRPLERIVRRHRRIPVQMTNSVDAVTTGAQTFGQNQPALASASERSWCCCSSVTIAVIAAVASGSLTPKAASCC